MIFSPDESEDQRDLDEETQLPLERILEVGVDKDEFSPSIAATSAKSLETLRASPNSDV